MVSDPGIYDSLAGVLSYPDDGFETRLDHCEHSLVDADPNLQTRFAEGAVSLRGLSRDEREETYARTFDMSPKCTLELGWHLFGESYDRGTFLVWMRQHLREYSLMEAADLPDHVRHVLPVLGRMDPKAADKFSCACVLPAIETIRDAARELKSPYTATLDVICGWLETRHGPSIGDTTSLPILTEQHEALLHAEDV